MTLMAGDSFILSQSQSTLKSLRSNQVSQALFTFSICCLEWRLGLGLDMGFEVRIGARTGIGISVWVMFRVAIGVTVLRLVLE